MCVCVCGYMCVMCARCVCVSEAVEGYNFTRPKSVNYHFEKSHIIDNGFDVSFL